MRTLVAAILTTVFGATAHAGSLVVQNCPNATGQLTVGSIAADVLDINGNSCVIVSAVPFATSASTSNGELVFVLPTVPGAYFYLTDFSLTGNGPTDPGKTVLISYYNMSGGLGVEALSLDAIILPSTSQQVDFHRAYSQPWQSLAPGLGVKIVVDKFGEGNVAVAARIVGLFR